MLRGVFPELGIIYVYFLSFDWFVALFGSALIGPSDYYGLGYLGNICGSSDVTLRLLTSPRIISNTM